ncbi:hypothetical protein [Aeropyrum camini]|uniref:hypothetical protein n=1 Tax=Aeropyrum camini TaxID=229980 RepID=UPI0007882AE8|nr:hypothetical protein [Aeropyrum camini]
MTSGLISLDSVDVELPYQLDRGQFLYFMVYKGQAEVLADVLSSSISGLLESGVVSRATGEDIESFSAA